MRRTPHENVATVLVEPGTLADLELALMELDLRVWPIRSAPNVVDGPRTAFQVRRRLVMAQRGAWDLAEDWVPVWVTFGDSWREGAEPLPWRAHDALWSALAAYADHVRFHRRLGGVRPLLRVPLEADH
ncbi:hypothetical protein KUV85_04440 [Nocardioides panacisoli]|uniref:hypothetical protein n=1 Tax=Nocardioides panacisoli TaxID=627624 RepID=UPI001C625C05|nr:hypothetical protein [Nocardioides panacisoli]QYJ04942.1 hypothetical protein KUV85_04440 [Nocardioides panacisoli]